MSIESTSPSTSILQGGSVVSTANPLQVSLANTAANATAVKVDGTGGTFPISGAVTIADGADVAEGAIADAAVTAGATGTISAKLRSISRDLVANIVLAAGSALIGKVGIDQTTPGTTNAVAGDVASGSSDSSNPLKLGVKAASAVPTAFTAGQRANVLGDLFGRLFVRTGHQAPAASTFTQTHIPNTNVLATKSQAAGTGTQRNVCTGFTVTLTAGASAITAAAPLTVMVVDGATTTTTYLWRSYINIPATAGAQISIVRSNIWLVGSQATAMTVEFSAAGGTNSYESVTFDGCVISE